MHADGRSPIVAIRQKELDLADRIAAAKEAAEQAIAGARRWASECRERAQREGQEEAAAFYTAEIAAADAEAQRLETESEFAAARTAQLATSVLETAVRRILEIVLPSLEKE